MELWDQACDLHLHNRFDEAEDLYVQLLEQNHDNNGLMATLGSLYVQTGKVGLGIHFLEAAVKGGLKQTDVFTNLGIGYKKAGQTNKARQYFDESLKGDPSPQALSNYSGLLVEAGQDEKCIELCEKAIAADPELPIAHWNLALSLLSEGAWERAWEEYDWGLKAKGVREDRLVLRKPIWDGTPGKTVLVYGEQGLGDEIMFTSMLPDLLNSAGSVIYECHERLETLFKRSFPDVRFYGTRESRSISWADNHQIDYRIPIGSLGRFYRRSKESFPGTPYLKAEALKSEKFRVGISWIGGGAKIGRVQKRSIPLSWWQPILNVAGIEFVSLQYTESQEDVDLVNALGYDIKVMDEYVKAHDYYETARLVASCDLVISVCTSVVHLAGALGVPCWVMTPRWPAWRYQNSGPLPWYRSVRLYRSPTPEMAAWIPVIARLSIDLEALMAAQARQRAA